MLETLPLYYDGKSQPAPAGTPHLTLKAPATGEPYAQVPLCDAAAVGAVVRSAQSAFPAWRDTPVA
ncbi:MAG: aldehyde dehydrogenase family protein, partial [SAR324 cluster bacterium]